MSFVRPRRSHAGCARYACGMMTIALEEAATSLAELAARVEGGETIVVTRNGRPVLDLVPHRRKGGLDLEAGQAFLRAHGITGPFLSIPDDCDAPLPEDFLIRPLQRQASNP